MTTSPPSRVTCVACGCSNRPNAMFCIGCARPLPTFVPTGPSALESVRSLPRRSSARAQSQAPSPALPAETPWFWLRLALLVLAMMIVFMGWYVSVTQPGAGSDVASAEVAPGPASQPEPKPEVKPQAKPEAKSAGPSAAPVPGPVPAPARAPTTPAANSSSDAASEAPGPSRGDAPVEAVAKFYRALAAADGATAAALVVPAKRGRGPFRAEAISSFYGSLQEPLTVRSIRTIDRNRVEVRYRYRASRTPCEGTAIVETASVLQQTQIRSIRANC
jgi:hypothetical protein